MSNLAALSGAAFSFAQSDGKYQHELMEGHFRWKQTK
jgi:hypothetical protein